MLMLIQLSQDIYQKNFEHILNVNNLVPVGNIMHYFHYIVYMG